MSSFLSIATATGLAVGALQLGLTEAICTYEPNTLTYQASLGGPNAALDIGQCSNPRPQCLGDCGPTEITYGSLTYEKVTECGCTDDGHATDCNGCEAASNSQVIGIDANGHDIVVDLGTCEGSCQGLVDMNLTLSADDSVVGIWVDGVNLTLGANSINWGAADTYLFSLDPSVDHVIAVHVEDIGTVQVGLIGALYPIQSLGPNGAALSAPVWGTGTNYLHQFTGTYGAAQAGWEQPGFNDSTWNTTFLQGCPAMNGAGYPQLKLPFVEYQVVEDPVYWHQYINNPCDSAINITAGQYVEETKQQYFRWYIKASDLQQFDAAASSCEPLATETRTIPVAQVVDCECICEPPQFACAAPSSWSDEECRCVTPRGGLEPST